MKTLNVRRYGKYSADEDAGRYGEVYLSLDKEFLTTKGKKTTQENNTDLPAYR